MLESCDIKFENARVIDGTGGPTQVADVAITGDRITGVGQLNSTRASTLVDASDLTLAPGFIDAHTHDDRALIAYPDMTAKVSQGVTTVVTGNCGISIAPLTGREPVPPLNLLGEGDKWTFPDFDAYAETMDRSPSAVNSVMLTGHSTLRVGTMDQLDRAATPAEIDAMVETLGKTLSSGCVGLSTGLAYGRDANVATVISHHKVCGRDNWGDTRESLKLIADARQHQTIDCDVYPYTASSFVHRADRVMITWSKSHPEFNTRDLDDVASEMGCDVATAIERLQPAGAIYFQMSDEDLERVLKFEGAMIGSDGLPHDEHPHPRLWGTFPKVVGHYARDRGLFSVEEAVHRMTGKTASVFGLTDRGLIRPGAFADLVLFNADTIIDRANYESPEQPSEGIHQVYVNGQTVYDGGRSTDSRPGRLLRA